MDSPVSVHVGVHFKYVSHRKFEKKSLCDPLVDKEKLFHEKPETYNIVRLSLLFFTEIIEEQAPKNKFSTTFLLLKIIRGVTLVHYLLELVKWH